MNLRKLSNQKIEENLGELVKQERFTLHAIILHIQEVVRRDLHLARGKTLKKYLIEDYQYSESAANRRISAALFADELPEAVGRIATGEIQLSQICQIQGSVRAAEKEHGGPVAIELKREILSAVAGCSASRTEEICAAMLKIPIQDYEKVRTQANGSRKLQIVLTKEQFEKYEKVRDLLAHRNLQAKRSQKFADILETCFDFIIAKSTPGATAAAKTEWQSVTPNLSKIIIQRDQCCQFKSADGHKCESTFNLQADHIQPVWAGGKNTIQNLQAMCAAHNRFRYRQQTNLRH